MSEVKYTPERIAKLSDKVAKGHYLTQSEAEYLLNAYDALRAQLTAAQVEIQGLRSALEVTHRIALQFSDAKIGTANWTDARHDFMGQMMVNQKVFEESPNASAGERVRGLMEAAGKIVNGDPSKISSPFGPMWATGCFAQWEIDKRILEVPLKEALAALKEADRG